ncbi:hypothetical protein Ancab_028204 [Ancistrocladus abbreviatus]
MGDGPFAPNGSTMFGNTDCDFMDQLLDEGCWLQTAEISNFLQSGLSTSTAMGYPSYSLPSLETNSSNLNSFPKQNNNQEGGETPWNLPDSFPHAHRTAEEDLDSRSQYQNAMLALRSPCQTHNFLWQSNDLNRVWIAPEANPGRSSSVKDRLMRAIWHFKELNNDRDVLIQIWVPVRRGLKNFLTTVEQPYFHDPASTRLVNYRNVSEKYQFSADEDSKETLGLPGRVFLRKVPEWTPDVRFFREEEYPRISYAHMYDVRGSIALPVFERGSGNCLGVVEIVTTAQKVNYRPEVETVCRALEAVDLRCSDIVSPSKEKSGSEGSEAALPDILGVLRIVSDKHGLPLAQTWAPCKQKGKSRCWHSYKNAHCVSTIDSACYIRDPNVQYFHEACSEHHLLRGQGVVGKAFMTNQPCFATDVTAFTRDEYPLSHHAKIFGLHAAVAILVRSTYGGQTSYVMEFFLPSDSQEAGLTLHCKIIESVTRVIQQGCQNLHFLTVDDLQQQPSFPSKEMSSSSDEKISEDRDAKLNSLGSKKHRQEEASWISLMIESQKEGKTAAVSSGFMKDDLRDEFKVTNNWSNTESELQRRQVFHDRGKTEMDSRLQDIVERGADSSFGGHHSSRGRKPGEKRKTKAQKTLSLQVLRQYFAGSLKDAARNIGVCPTTLKRICRQHGITRWPSRKIKKVGHSLRKLQLVMDSVHGAQGSIQLSSFYTNFPPLNGLNLSNPNQISSIETNDQSKQLNTQPEGSIFSYGPATSKSISPSSSQTSTSSHSFSTGPKISVATATASGNLEASKAENTGGLLNRSQSEADVYVPSQETPALPEKSQSGTPFLLERSRSIKSLSEQPLLESTLPPLPKSSSVAMGDGDAYKVKVSFGEEKIRFSIPQNMGFKDLQLEIARRFGVDDMNKFHIKYLDDDKEWVLLTCDADLDECMEIQRSTRTHTIKLSIHRALPPSSRVHWEAVALPDS